MAITSADIAEAAALAAFLADRAEALGRRIGLPVTTALTTDDNTLAGTVTLDFSRVRDPSITLPGAAARLAAELVALAAGVDCTISASTDGATLTLAGSVVVATPAPDPAGPTILFAETFATDPAPRWDAAVGTWLPTGGEDSGGAFDLSADDAAALEDDTILQHLTAFPGPDTPTASRAWSLRVRARWVHTTSGATTGLSRVMFDNDQYDWPARVFIEPNDDLSIINAGCTLVTRSGSYDTADSAAVDVTATLGDGGWHWLELLYEDADEQATCRVYADDALIATLVDTSGPRAANTYPMGARIDGPEVGTMVVDRVTLADGFQGV